MTPPIQLQRLPKRKRSIKPARSRAFVLCVAVICAAIFCASCTGPDAIWWV